MKKITPPTTLIVVCKLKVWFKIIARCEPGFLIMLQCFIKNTLSIEVKFNG